MVKWLKDKMETQLLVVLHTKGHKEDRSWACQTHEEATQMVKWLKDNHIEAIQCSHDTWNQLPTYWEI
jgi:hypothetical protein